jgi:tetratricopeptide (TPR) repeat protein
MKCRLLCALCIALLLGVGILQGASTPEEKIRAFGSSIKEEAAGDLTRSIQILLDASRGGAPDYLMTLRLGWLYYNAREYDKSEKYYREAMRISDNSIEALLGVTLPCAARGKWDLVQEAYATILSRDRLNYTANLRLGQILLNQGSTLRAKKHFDLLAENYPGDYETNLYLGWTYYNLGSRAKAHEAFGNAVSLYPADTSAVKGFGLTQ